MSRRRTGALPLLLAAITLATGCTRDTPAADGRTVLTLWRHETGDAEMNASRAAIARFNAEQQAWRVETESLPQGSYTESITAAALARQLPCILDVDQPAVPNFAWTGHLRPLDALLPSESVEAITRGARGTYNGRLYSVGQFDVALALFARRSVLARHGVRVATMAAPYAADELRDIVRRLKAAGAARFPLDILTTAAGEWVSYGYSPWLQSAGGDLIDRDGFVRAEGVLNGEASRRAVAWYRSLFAEGLVERQAIDDQALLQDRAVFQYTGSWAARALQERFGDDLAIMPPPDFGAGPRIGAGSWQWGISRSCPHPEGAAAFLTFLLRPGEIAAMSEATGLVPVSDAAAARTAHYREGGRWRLFYEFAKAYAVQRPQTPAYPKISSAFEKAMFAVRDGRPIRDALDDAVDDIEYDIERNRGYGFEAGAR